MDSATLEKKIASLRENLAEVCAVLEQEISKLGLESEKFGGISVEEAVFSLKTDPFSGEASLEGNWFKGKNERKGSILFHSDGTFYAEWDVIAPHPRKRSWFVEAVTAWGKGDSIKSEAKLLHIEGNH